MRNSKKSAQIKLIIRTGMGMMLKIGEFSALSGISIHMLRNYDKIGLLKPERIERMNNYRLYGEKQIVRANHIQVLKSLGFGLSEISAILTDDTLDDRIKAFLESQIREKEESLSSAERQIAQMRQALHELDTQDGCTLSVSVKDFLREWWSVCAALSGNSVMKVCCGNALTVRAGQTESALRMKKYQGILYAQKHTGNRNGSGHELYRGKRQR
jgi:DNA-binding transcriptional MerR regulator